MLDLFGEEIPEPEDDIERAVDQRDEDRFEGRTQRLRYLNTIYPSERGYAMRSDYHYLYDELMETYIDGHFVGCILLSQAFIEHILEDYLRSKVVRLDNPTLAKMLRILGSEKLLPPFIIEKIDELRKKRNPFVHLREYDDPYLIVHRSLKRGLIPEHVLENDAKEALGLAFIILDLSFRGLRW